MSNGKVLKVVLDDQGIQALLKGQDMQAVLEETASQLPLEAGYEYKSSTYVGRTRANVQISCGDFRTYRHEQKTNSLLKALKGGKTK